ncbi:MAG: FAD-binding oxidoreductase [Anaerolineae bacterium]|jgi:D-lactate dehydrogenase (cytochrome)|nr:FAD-binding oxidoreductase [Anaerolineae bacterium]
MTYSPITPNDINVLTEIVGPDQLTTTHADRLLRAKDQSQHAAKLAEVILFPQTALQVAEILRYANQRCIPITPWGVGTSLEGNPIPQYGGITLSLERMTRIIKVHHDDFQVTVEPGIGHKDLNRELARFGLFFPPDPGANATIGGMLANNAAGIRTVKYGASKDNVLRMQVALADGRLIHVGSRSIKQSAGYDLLHLFVGSEGTLGIITEATLKLVPLPQLMSAVVASFPTISAAIETVVAIKASGLDPAALEFIDPKQCAILRDHAGVNLEEKPTLFMEFHATHRETLEYGLQELLQICNDQGATGFRATTDHAERAKLWQARHHAFETLVRVHPGKTFVIDDVSVPLSAYPVLIAYIEAQLAEHDVPAYMKGHAGDGNIHVEFPFGDAHEYDRAMQVNDRIVLKAIELGGTCTGEHGVGIGKAKYMQAEHGQALAVMWAIKQTLDPNRILNPGKIFPPDFFNG